MVWIVLALYDKFKVHMKEEQDFAVAKGAAYVGIGRLCFTYSSYILFIEPFSIFFQEF